MHLLVANVPIFTHSTTVPLAIGGTGGPGIASSINAWRRLQPGSLLLLLASTLHRSCSLCTDAYGAAYQLLGLG